MKSEAKIGILVQNGRIAIKSEIKGLSQAELALLIVQIELLRDDLKSKFGKGVRKIEE